MVNGDEAVQLNAELVDRYQGQCKSGSRSNNVAWSCNGQSVRYLVNRSWV